MEKLPPQPERSQDGEDEESRDRREARERLDRALRDARSRHDSTSTREPGLPVFQEFQESQDRQVLHESPSGDISEPRQAPKQEDYADLFALGDYGAIPEATFLSLAWEASKGKNWENDGVSETWEFCRYLLAHPKFDGLAPAALVRKLRRLTDFEDEDLETVLAEIARVQFAKGRGPLDWAIGMAAQYPITDPEELGLERYNRFLSIAGWLQVMRGSAPVYLPVEKLAKILNVTARAVSNWRALALRQGVLTETTPYERRKKATEFRFAVERFGVLRERRNL